jgi:Na+/H+-dicarboxylate symporter
MNNETPTQAPATNAVSNSIAAAVVAKWENQLSTPEETEPAPVTVVASA